MRLVLLLHRYLGIAVGVLMLMWCLSGIVMMYESYPSLDEGARLKHLEPIDWSGCCKLPPPAVLDTQSVSQIQVEMLAGHPVLTFGRGSTFRSIDMLTGSLLGGVSTAQAMSAAVRFGPAGPSLLGLIDHDQWTVGGEYESQRPLYRFAAGDEARSDIYVSGITGRVVQITTAHQRFWNWIGSVPHWLYFTQLRRHAVLWSQVVIYTSLLGCFLVGVGLYLGAYQLAVQPRGSWSPYGGFNRWHHLVGLIFGIFALSWVLSGLLSMNPWGWLEGAGAQAENSRLRGTVQPDATALTTVLRALSDARPTDIVSIKGAPMGGRLYFIATMASGERRRLDAAGLPAPLTGADLMFVAKILDSSGASSAPQLMTENDDFYFNHHSAAVALPVYRVVDGVSGTRYYLDPVSGMILAKIDRSAQAYRWLHEGMHRLDFAAALRDRPQWDLIMLLLMTGVTAVCGTGAYLGCRHVARLLRSSRS
ncbi:MAG TPA: PepSY domain-containing protein [Steroidobacteraceae bacterium]|jgi:hypothetical protein